MNGNNLFYPRMGRPGRYDYEVSRGPEYQLVRGEILANDVTKTLTVRTLLRRIAHLSREGWWSGETHLLALLQSLPDVITLDFRTGRPAHSMDAPVALDQQYNLLLSKTITGDGPVHFTVQETDLLSEQGPGMPLFEGFNKRLTGLQKTPPPIPCCSCNKFLPEKPSCISRFKTMARIPGSYGRQIWRSLLVCPGRL